MPTILARERVHFGLESKKSHVEQSQMHTLSNMTKNDTKHVENLFIYFKFNVMNILYLEISNILYKFMG